MASDLDELRELFPRWLICAIWRGAASGPDWRDLWASRDGVLVHALSKAALTEKIRNVERRQGWDDPPGPPVVPLRPDP